MQIITGYTGESHVTSADDASLYRGILGRDDYVLDVGNKFAATIIDNNTVRIMDGDLVIQGHQARIRANDYEEVTIDNGTPGEKRNDLIVARYQKNTTTGVESITLEVVKGTLGGETAVDPEIVQEDLTTGGSQREFALYRVSLNGLALESITSLFTVLPNLEAFNSHLADIVSELVLVDRDLSLTGTQTVTTTTQKDIKSIIAFGQISDTMAFCIALADKTKARGTLMYGVNGKWGQVSNGLRFSRVGGSSTTGEITNLGKGEFDIIWSHAGDGATGTGVCKFLVQFHGE